MKKSPNAYKHPDADLIIRAADGNLNAIKELIAFYEPYINKLSTIYLKNKNGKKSHYFIDEDRKQMITLEFIQGIKTFGKILHEKHF